MVRKASHFSVDSKGHCFLCLNKIPGQLTPTAKEDDTVDILPSSVHSFQEISRYLKIDMAKVFTHGGRVPPHLLAIVERAKLKVELCEECAFMTETISNQCRQLEKLRLEISSGLESIHGKMSGADETGRTKRFRGVAGLEFKLGTGGWMEILEAFRLEAMQKCSLQINNASPRLQIQKLTPEEIQKRTFRIPKEEAETSPEPMSDSELRRQTGGPACVNRPLDDDFRTRNWDMEQGIKLESGFEATPYSKIKMENVPEPELSIISSFRNDDWAVDGKLSEFDDYPTSDEELPEIATIPTTSKAPKRIQKNTKGMKGKVRSMNSDKKYISPATRKRSGSRNWRFDPDTGKRKCNDCSKEFNSKPAFTFHYQTIHLKLSYKCISCKNVFSTKGSLKLHRQTSQRCSVRGSAPKFKCHLCEMSFTQKISMQDHLDGIHYKLQNYACDLCDKKFNTRYELARHKRKLHGKAK